MESEIKRKLFQTYAEIDSNQQRGVYWMGKFDEIVFNPGTMLSSVAFIKVIFPTIPIWASIIALLAMKWGTQVVRYFIGKIDKKVGLWEKQSYYGQTQKHISPFNVALAKSIKEQNKAIKEFTGKEVPDYFEDL